MQRNKPKNCSHRFVNGDTCAAMAMAGENYCYYHLRYKSSNDPAGKDYELPLLEDKESIQLVVRDIMRGILNGQLEARRASQLLYALQIASNNLARWEKLPNDEDDGEPEEPEQPFMLKFLGESLAGAKVASGPDAGKPVSEVFARNISEAAEKKDK